MKKITLGLVGLLVVVACVAPVRSFAAETDYKLTAEQKTALVQTLVSLGEYLKAIELKIQLLKATNQLTETQKSGISATLVTLGQTLAVLDKSIQTNPGGTPSEPVAGANTGNGIRAEVKTNPKIAGADSKTNTGAELSGNKDDSNGQVAGVAATTNRSGRFLWWSFILLLVATGVALFYSWRPIDGGEAEATSAKAPVVPTGNGGQTTAGNVQPNKPTVNGGQIIS